MTSRSERARELEAKDLAKERAARELAEATHAVVQEEIGKLVDAARESPELVIDEENTAVRRLADITGRSGTRPKVEPSPPEAALTSPVPFDLSGPVTKRPIDLDTASRTERVLIVEDDQILASELAEILKDEGYSVRTAEDGIEALRKTLKDRPPPDVIILDMGLPYLSGAGVIAALQTTHLATLPVLVVSASSPDSLPAEVQRDYVFVKKPIRMPELLRVVRERIGEWRARLRG